MDGRCPVSAANRATGWYEAHSPGSNTPSSSGADAGAAGRGDAGLPVPAVPWLAGPPDPVRAASVMTSAAAMAATTQAC